MRNFIYLFLTSKIRKQMNYYKLYEIKDKIESNSKKFYYNGSYTHLLAQHDKGYFTQLILIVKENLLVNSRILDVGCGSGYSSYLLSKEGYYVVGLDLNPFPKKLKSKQSKRLQYRRGDALHLPFKENSFDAVIFNDVIEHITNVERCLLNAKRVLRPNGVLIILSPCLITPFRPFVSFVRILKGEKGIPVWGENLRTCVSNIFKFSIFLCHKVVLYCLGKVDFRYRLPDLKKAKDIGGDADAVYWANPFEIITFLEQQNFKIIKKETSILLGFKGRTRIIAKKVMPYDTK